MRFFFNLFVCLWERACVRHSALRERSEETYGNQFSSSKMWILRLELSSSALGASAVTG